MKEFEALASAMKVDLSYNEDAKARFHRSAMKALRVAAEQLGLSKEQYDLRSNKAGIAVSGEVTLHTDKLYIQVAQSCMGEGHEIMYRSCKGRKDYTGGYNQFMGIHNLANKPVDALRKFKLVMEG